MKFLKLLFSKIFVTAIALLVQVALVVAVVFLFEQYILAFQIFSSLVGLIVFLDLVGKKESPEFKLPWLFLLMIAPFFGTTVYCLFGRSRMAYKDYKHMAITVCDCKKYFEMTPSENEEIKSFLGDKKGLEMYLRTTSFSRGYLGNKVEYFKSGLLFFEDLKRELEKAEKFIFMEYFVVDYGKMWGELLEILARKAKDGVEVRFMYDDIGCAGLLKSNYFKKLRAMGINCYKFNPFRPVISGVHNNRDHRKITVIDGKVGYTGGANLADEYINAKTVYGYWKDSAIKIQGKAVRNLTGLFLQLFDTAAKSFSDYSKYLDVECEEFEDGGFIHPFGDGPKPFYVELVGSNNFINILNSAHKYVYISTPYLIPDYNLVTALRLAAQRGVDVRIVTPHIPDKKIILNMTRSNYAYLLEGGVKIYEYTPGFVHAKEMVADGEVAFVGTINLDYRSLVHHYECGAVMYKTPCIKDIEAEFQNTFKVSGEITLENFRMKFFPALLNSILNLFSPMF